MATTDLPDRARALLTGTPIAFLTTMRPDGHMSTNPVSVLLDDDGRILVSTTTDRKKARNLRADDRITLCVVQPSNMNRYVEIRGHATLAPDPDRALVNRIAQVYMGVDEYPFDPAGAERLVVTVVPEQISCPWVPLADDPPHA